MTRTWLKASCGLHQHVLVHGSFPALTVLPGPPQLHHAMLFDVGASDMLLTRLVVIY